MATEILPTLFTLPATSMKLCF